MRMQAVTTKNRHLILMKTSASNGMLRQSQVSRAFASWKNRNAAELFAMPDVDGGLVGGASLKADEFLSILAAAGPG